MSRVSSAGPAPVCEAQLSEKSLATAQKGPFPEHEATLKIKTKKANEPISLFLFPWGPYALVMEASLATYQQPQRWGGAGQ